MPIDEENVGNQDGDLPADTAPASEAHNLLSDLNLRQAEAVAAPPGPLLVLAGPGSGKTRILTYRAAWLA
ncbi:MAG TPA: UvrD-helicase domain-containing protein, partial [Anaerolineae bacterium]